MIYVNNTLLTMTRFPDGTCGNFSFKDLIEPKTDSWDWDIVWKYESDEEYIQLYYIVNHIRQNYGYNKIYLTMNYIPNARMDRVKDSPNEIFTLKYFANFINSLNFDCVYVFDPHSDVSLALIDRVKVNPYLSNYIRTVINTVYNIEGEEPVIYFPDAGAMKRYSGLDCFKDMTFIYGSKKRDWKTGNILGLDIMDVNGEILKETVGFDYETKGLTPEDFEEVENTSIIKPLEGRIILMIDDIISYGGTLAYSADKLKELGCGSIYAYASHTENSVLDENRGKLLERLKSGVVKTIFTSNSLYSGDSEYIKVFKI